MASTSGPLAWASRLADSEERLLDTRVTSSAHRLNRSELTKLLAAVSAAFTAEEAATTELEASVERWHRSRARVLRRPRLWEQASLRCPPAAHQPARPAE